MVIYNGPLEPDFLLQMLGLVLFRAGGEQTFTAAEINEINRFVDRVRIISPDGTDSLTLRLTSKGGGPDADSETKPPYIAPKDSGANRPTPKPFDREPTSA